MIEIRFELQIKKKYHFIPIEKTMFLRPFLNSKGHLKKVYGLKNIYKFEA